MKRQVLTFSVMTNELAIHNMRSIKYFLNSNNINKHNLSLQGKCNVSIANKKKLPF